MSNSGFPRLKRGCLERVLPCAFANLVEVVHVQLSYEAGIVAVLEVDGQDLVTEVCDVLNEEESATTVPTYLAEKCLTFLITPAAQSSSKVALKTRIS